MQLWNRLYNTVWLAFFSCVLIPRWMGAPIGYPVHALLGAGLLLMTIGNTRSLAGLPVPNRLQRISKVTMGFAVFQLVAGIALGGVIHLGVSLPYVETLLRAAHIVCALTILAQASSVATAYDMWEEKEFAEAPRSSVEQSRHGGARH